MSFPNYKVTPMEPSQINLDDIFGAIAPLEIPVTDNHSEVHQKSRSGTHQSEASHASHHSTASKTASYAPSEVSHVSSHHHHSVTGSHHSIPAEPKSRASTVQSEASSVSTLKADHPSDDLMASVFGAVPLGEVGYRQDHDQAIQNLDDVLAGESTDGHNDGSSVVSGYRASAHYSVPPSHHSSHAPSSHAPSTHSRTATQVSRTSGKSGASHQVAQSVVHSTFDDLQLIGHHGHDGYDHSMEPEIPAPDYADEAHDQFEPAHLPFSHKDHNGLRPRTMTMDSQVSMAETRYGGFDVHDELGHYMGQEIDLHHNEVAYQRPKKKSHSVPKAPSAASYVSTADRMHLEEINREVARAHLREDLLKKQVERERAEVERLTARKQQSVGGRSSHTTSISSYGAPVLRSESVGSVESYKESYHRAASIDSRNAHSHDSIYEEEPVKISEIAQVQKENGQVVGESGKYSLVLPWTEEVPGFSKNSKVRKIIIGGHAPATEDDKTVLLFGPIGSGKTSAITSIINYLYDVKKENDFRFTLQSGESKHTTALTAYVINNSILPFSVTIVDTPGVVDEKNNKTVSTLIKTWFEQELVEAGAFRLDAISIVLRHDEDSLGWPFIYELAAVKKMFGDDLKTNVLPIITNSEVLPQPIAIRSLAQANIAFVEYYKVNNVGFQPEAKGITKLQHNLFFTHGMASLEQFFRDLQELIHPLLAVLRNGTSKMALASHSFEGSALY